MNFSCDVDNCSNIGKHGIRDKNSKPQILCHEHFLKMYPEKKEHFGSEITKKLMNEYHDVLNKLSRT